MAARLLGVEAGGWPSASIIGNPHSKSALRQHLRLKRGKNTPRSSSCLPPLPPVPGSATRSLVTLGALLLGTPIARGNFRGRLQPRLRPHPPAPRLHCLRRTGKATPEDLATGYLNGANIYPRRGMYLLASRTTPQPLCGTNLSSPQSKQVYLDTAGTRDRPEAGAGRSFHARVRRLRMRGLNRFGGMLRYDFATRAIRSSRR